jgi:hypothetical protein
LRVPQFGGCSVNRSNALGKRLVQFESAFGFDAVEFV